MAQNIRHSKPAIGGRLARRIGLQVAVIGVLSITLGFAFNASNPIGIRLTAAAPPSQSAAKPDAASAPTHPSNPGAVTAAAPATAPDSPASVTATVTHWPEVKPLLAAGQIVLVDARPAAAFEAGHIPGAISLPFTADPEAYGAFRAQHPTGTHLVIYCSSTSCSLSKQLAEKLISEFGYHRVEYMTGGYQEWQQAELGGSAATVAAPLPAPQTPEPVIAPAAAAPAITPSSATADPMPILSTPTTWDAVKPLLQSSQIVLVDARPKPQFDAGHIPGAISLPFSTGTEDYESFVKEHTPHQHVIVYCSSTSCSLAKRLADKLAKEYGFKRVQFMTGGYQEWQKAELSQTKAGS